MATFTARANLTKPAGTEARSIVPVNANADLIDKFLGCILVNDGVTPPTGDLFDGAIVKERTSGIIWEARLNGGGTFDKVYIRYPFHIQAFHSGAVIAAGSAVTHTQWVELNSVTVGALKNASAANIVSGRFVIPVKGIWKIRICHIWQQNSSGNRALALTVNSSAVTGEWEQIQLPNTAFQHKIIVEGTRPQNVGDTIGLAGWQNSGGSLNLDEATLRAALIEPVQ